MRLWFFPILDSSCRRCMVVPWWLSSTRAARRLGLEKLINFTSYSISADQGTQLWGFWVVAVTGTWHVMVAGFTQASATAQARGGGPLAMEQRLVEAVVWAPC
jgi:hypothetical protein